MRKVAPILLFSLLAASFVFAQQPKKRSSRPRYTTPDLKVGDVAPDFELVQLDESGSNHTSRVKLSSWRGSKPVLLFFSSYT